jgi:PIN domain nuclease of toxin-antitoxin system
MSYLLDTHVLLWYINGDTRLSQSHQQLIEDPETDIALSYVSLWEITIKVSLNKLKLSGDIEELIALINDTGISLIDISTQDLIELKDLPFHHRDPFDRLLVAQAKSRDMTLLTEDGHIKSYSAVIPVV